MPTSTLPINKNSIVQRSTHATGPRWELKRHDVLLWIYQWTKIFFCCFAQHWRKKKKYIVRPQMSVNRVRSNCPHVYLYLERSSSHWNAGLVILSRKSRAFLSVLWDWLVASLILERSLIFEKSVRYCFLYSFFMDWKAVSALAVVNDKCTSFLPTGKGNRFFPRRGVLFFTCFRCRYVLVLDLRSPRKLW